MPVELLDDQGGYRAGCPFVGGLGRSLGVPLGGFVGVPPGCCPGVRLDSPEAGLDDREVEHHDSPESLELHFLQLE